MSDIVGPLLEYINAHPDLAGMITFTLSATESVAIVGTIVPGSITMTAIGALAGAGIIPLWETLSWAILGAIVGDGISYWIGYHFKDRLRSLWPFRKYPNLLKTGETFFHRHGSMSVFVGRFVGPVRALVPLVAGMLGMKPLNFFIANIVSAIGWAPTYMLPGILLGGVALELPPDIALHVILALILVTLAILLLLWFLYQLLKLMHHHVEQFQNWLWHALKQSRYFSIVITLLNHYDPKQSRHQLRLALYDISFAILLLILIVYVKSVGSATIGINDTFYHLFHGIRDPVLGQYMLNITLLGEQHVLLPVIVSVVLSLFICKRYWTGWHALVLTILTTSATHFIKQWVGSIRPWGMAHPIPSYSMPSGHTTLSTTVFMGLAFLIAIYFPSKRRWPIYLFGGCLTFLIGFSRMYLGAHWFTDVLSGWLLSAVLLIAIIISFRHRFEKTLHPLFILAVSIVPLSISVAYFHAHHFKQMQQEYAKLPYPSVLIRENEWWRSNNMIPANHASLFGFPSQTINIEWVGTLNQIQSTLLRAGWSFPKERDWVSILHRIADIQSDDYLPMISPQYLDQKPRLVLTKYIKDGVNGKKKLLVLRFWNSYRIMEGNHQILWVATVGSVPRTYSFLLMKRHLYDVYLNPDYFFAPTRPTNTWHWKISTIPYFISKKKVDYQKVMLIKG